MTKKNWLQAGIAAALLASGALVAGAAHASICPANCPNGQPHTALNGSATFPWGSTQTVQTPPCGDCFGSMWAKYQSSGSNMVVTITTGSGFSGDCAEIAAFDSSFHTLSVLANTNDGTSVGQSVPGTPVTMGGWGLVCQYP